jgi:hypothetical protein
VRSIGIELVAFLCLAVPGMCQDGSALAGYFTGKEVLVKIDMPGSQKGIDLKYNKPSPMDWNEYSSRIKAFGVAIHKGDVARVTKFVVKSDMIEFQLNGGGFGTAGDDSNTTVTATSVPKSQYEKDLEKQIAATTDDKKKRELQQDLDRERSRRERQDAQNQSAAQVASQIKQQEVADKRLQGGSRFNLRWDKTIPSDSRNPDAVMRLLAEYVDFNPAAQGAPAGYGPVPQYGPAPPSSPDSGGQTAQLKRGMKMDEVQSLLGQGRTVSDTTSPDGLKTRVMEYATQDSLVDVTFVEGVVVRYTISSR